jgi:hypothetical protein
MRNRKKSGRRHRTGRTSAVALLPMLVAWVALPASGAAKKAKRVTKPKTQKSASATPKKGSSKTTAASKAFEAPPGAGQSAPAVEVDALVNPRSADEFRSAMSAQFAIPLWFPIPDSIVRDAKRLPDNTIRSVSVRQDLPTAGSDSKFSMSVSVSYIQPQFTAEQALNWVKTRPGSPNFQVTDGVKTATGSLPTIFEFGDESLHVFLDDLRDGPGQKPKPGQLVRVTSFRMLPAGLPGLISSADWPQGVPWESTESLFTHQLSTFEDGEVDYRGVHSVSLLANTSIDNSSNLKQTLSNPASYSGTIRLAGAPSETPSGEDGDTVWSVPITWFGRPGRCYVKDLLARDRPRAPARCEVNFSFKAQ